MKDSKERVAARAALSNILLPLVGFAVDVGLSARELQAMFRAVAVNVVADRQKTSKHRVSISGIAAVTGIPRAEVSKILKAKTNDGHLALGVKPHSMNKILSVWNENPRFTDRTGRPVELRIFGRGQTFEALISRYGRGLPVRAVLDELVRSNSVEVIGSQRLKLNSPVIMDRVFSSDEMKSLSRSVAQLIESMVQKFRDPESQFVLSHIEGDISEDAALPIFRKEVMTSSDDLLTGLRESLFRTARGAPKSKPANGNQRIRVTVVYQETPKLAKQDGFYMKRRYLRRSK